MKRVKPVYFADQRGFLLTFGPDDEDLHRWTAPLSSDRIREIFGTDSFAAIRAASGADGVRRWMRDRLRTAMEAESRDEPSAARPIPARAGSWLDRDRATALRVEGLLETWAPEAARVLDPFAGTGLYPVVASQRDCETFWCEISPIARFLAVTRFRALYREDAERRRLAERVLAFADGLPAQIARVPAQGSAALRWIADHADWDSAIVRDLFRAAVISLLIDDEPLDPQSVANELRRHAHYLAAQKPIRTAPTQLADDASDLGAMRPVHADVLLTSFPSVDAPDPFPSIAEEFLGIDSSAERRLAMPATVEVPRGRGTSLHLDNSLRRLRESSTVLGRERTNVIDRLLAIVNEVDEPGKASSLAHYFTAAIRISSAMEHQLAAAAVAIVDAPDSWIAGRLIRNAEVVREIFTTFGFEEVATEATTIRVMPSPGEPVRREHRVVVMRRSARPSRPAAAGGWAAWA